MLRLGWLADYLSRPVLVGYIHGVAVVLIVGQLGKLTGVDVDAGRPLPQIVEVVRELGDVSGPTLAVGVAALLVLIPARFVAPRLPAALVVVVAAIVASKALDLGARGRRASSATSRRACPDLQVPTPAWEDVVTLAPAAAGVFLVAFADEVLTARSFAGRHGQHIRADQELLAMGVANAAAGISQGLPVGASGSRTAVNDSMGARSQIAGLLAAGAIVLVLLFLTAPIADLPKAVLGAVIVAAAIGLIDPAAWRELASDRPRRARDRRGDGRRRDHHRRAGGDRLRRRALDRRRRPPQRAPARRGARLGRGARPLGGRLRAPLRARDARRGRLPARRPAVLRQRELRQGPRARRRCGRRRRARTRSSSTPRR